MDSRPSKLKNYMDMAEVAAQRSHDAETKVGAILVNNKSGSVLAISFNGFVRGAPDSVLPNVRPHKYEYVMHAEQNLITNCARHSIGMNDCTLVCTLTPCKLCMRLLFNCGITNVIAKEQYKDFDDILKMQDIKVKTKYSKEGFIIIKYEVD